MQKQVVEERMGMKKRVFKHFFVKLLRKTNFLAIQGEYGKIIDVIRRKLCVISV